ncbi:hypothetical protein EIN_250770 [Entamoeba invadens IP1]|uniref:Arf-GAP domain-containing protein n=1 Tax=Entamoeba invadens IP1 TaxID=370355 RepID=A0A0A1UEN6_ENTIV|nr:hypothetical protein EIN_250770 [Entamoeba invadens IP1]ELP94953.1 hypothetical protein EIN_250770 [Entamoeba invadens IP1]|eukprot:XP_004261724.1 hypothetical protein EIN_250770 [Entamoeba invadens IP1]
MKNIIHLQMMYVEYKAPKTVALHPRQKELELAVTEFTFSTFTETLVWVYVLRLQSNISLKGKIESENMDKCITGNNIMKALLLEKENLLCADCQEGNVKHVNLEFGCFLCEKCAELHQLTFSQTHPSEVYSISDASAMKKEKLTPLISKGNIFSALEHLETPSFNPFSTDAENLREMLLYKYNTKTEYTFDYVALFKEHKKNYKRTSQISPINMKDIC